ncbi:unnamed protein product [Protopolystoma xenopodis]|uniref:Uncharacterized protein n=1 Tax=Protopolystoma xenopodis TaxID=117903 RepID=A0A448XIJ5_9PLAT|nr:unnamed protein product [Protopolystoma xenopodis]
MIPTRFHTLHIYPFTLSPSGYYFSRGCYYFYWTPRGALPNLPTYQIAVLGAAAMACVDSFLCLMRRLGFLK